MFGKAAAVVVISLVWYFISEYRIWLDVDKVLYSKSPGNCRTILKDGGSEDFAELDEDTILVSSGLLWQGKLGKIYTLYTNGTIEETPMTNTIDKKNPLIDPHGLSIWKDPETGCRYCKEKMSLFIFTNLNVFKYRRPETSKKAFALRKAKEALGKNTPRFGYLMSGTNFLYVIIHEPVDEGVVVFEVKTSPVTLKYVKTIKDPEISGITNDLVVVGKDKFYITQSATSRNLLLVMMTFLSGLPTTKVFYYDGKNARSVGIGLAYGNGINISPDLRTLYVSEFLTKKIHALDIESNGDVNTKWVYQLDSCVDNIQVDQASGDLWVGSFPFLQTAVDPVGIFGSGKHVGQVLRLRITDNRVTDVEEIFANNGSLVTDTSVALYKNKKLFIGTVLRLRKTDNQVTAVEEIFEKDGNDFVITHRHL